MQFTTVFLYFENAKFLVIKQIKNAECIPRTICAASISRQEIMMNRSLENGGQIDRRKFLAWAGGVSAFAILNIYLLFGVRRHRAERILARFHGPLVNKYSKKLHDQYKDIDIAVRVTHFSKKDGLLEVTFPEKRPVAPFAMRLELVGKNGEVLLNEKYRLLKSKQELTSYYNDGLVAVATAPQAIFVVERQLLEQTAVLRIVNSRL